MGPSPLLLLRKDVRQEIGKGPGDRVNVIVTLDTAQRTVEVPGDLTEALERASARSRFDELSFSHRREYVQRIDEAKREETRLRRIEKAVELIASGKRLR
jgi:uncharacterized protein YdeI (YjbR/CyaY-like superfamily)